MPDSTSAVTVEPPSSISRLAGRFRQAVDYITEILTLHPYVFLGLASIGYFGITCYRAHRRLFWFDEIFTFYIARLPDIGSIWNACTHGVDFNPPLFYLLTRWSQGLFGATELGTRIPEIVGFWVFCLCLYRFVSIRANALAGLIALLLPLTSGAYWYAYEARPHGIVLGFFGLALLSWQAAASRASGRWAALAGLAGALSCAALCHCYAFLLFIPLGLGELTRTILRKRIDVAVWCALVLAATVSIFTVLPLLRGVKNALPPALLAAPLQRLWTGWDLSFKPAFAFVLLLLLCAEAVWPRTSPVNARRQDPSSAGGAFEWYEIAALSGILCTPFFAFLSARLAHAPLYGRYSLVTTAGVACLIGAAFARSHMTSLLALSMTLLLIAAQFAGFYRGTSAIEPSTYRSIGTQPAAESFRFDWIAMAAPGSDPIVLLDNLEFAPMFYYAPPSLGSRFAFLIPDGNGEGYARLQRCCGAPGTVSSQPDFLAAHRSFFVYAGEGGLPSDTDRFRRLGGQIGIQGCQSGHCLFRVDLPTSPSAAAASPQIEKGH
jgi:hypothetical protein